MNKIAFYVGLVCLVLGAHFAQAVDSAEGCKALLNKKDTNGKLVYWKNAKNLKEPEVVRQAVRSFYLDKILKQKTSNPESFEAKNACDTEVKALEKLNKESRTKFILGSSSGECLKSLREACGDEGFQKKLDSTLILISSVDQGKFTIPHSAAEQSQTIKYLLADAPAAKDLPVSLNSATISLMQTALIALDEEKDERKSEKAKELVFDLTAENLITVINAANYLNAANLLDAGMNRLLALKFSTVKSALEKNPIPKDLQQKLMKDNFYYISRARFNGYRARFSPDGQYILTGYNGELWKTESNADSRPLATFRHDKGVNAAAFSPDGQYILTGSNDKTAILWKAEPSATPQPLATFRPDGVVAAVAFSPDGKYVLTSLRSASKMWKAEANADPQPLAIFWHDNKNNVVAFSPDGKYVLTGFSSAAKIWKAEANANPQELATFWHNSDVTAIAFSPDGQYILTGSNDKTAILWKAEPSATPQPLATFRHDGGVNAVAFSPDGQYILTGSNDKTAILWKAEANANPQQLATFPHYGAVTAVAFSPDGKYVLTGSSNAAKIWKAEANANPQQLATFPHYGAVTAVAFSPDGKYVLTVAEGKTILWEPGNDFMDFLKQRLPN